jgi:hypothetical protein
VISAENDRWELKAVVDVLTPDLHALAPQRSLPSTRRTRLIRVFLPLYPTHRPRRAGRTQCHRRSVAWAGNGAKAVMGGSHERK